MTSHEQQVGSAIHKLRIGGVGLLELCQFKHQPLVEQDGCWVPSPVGDEAGVKDVKTTQALDAKEGLKKILQLVSGKQMKVHRNMASVAELELAPVQPMVELEVFGLLDRIDERGRCAAD
jgi:hypothetical protein